MFFICWLFGQNAKRSEAAGQGGWFGGKVTCRCDEKRKFFQTRGAKLTRFKNCFIIVSLLDAQLTKQRHRRVAEVLIVQLPAVQPGQRALVYVL